ncbi:hypothetical protein [Marinobacter salicampi]|uniref:hypothetical protein n=1 Tax=Marinobacter salicampi TaxID=435907 RepID=UPI00140A4E99|nr:hypothetical protein [Marinobacter salicampi]
MKQIDGDRKAKSAPVIKQNLSLSTLAAQKVMTRSFEKLAESLFQISVILRAIGEREHVDEAEEIMNKHFEAASTDIEAKIEQMKQLAEQHGVSISPDYTNQVTYELEINTPHLAQFTGLVGRMDDLVSIIDSLWLHSILDNRQASNARFEWSRRMINVAGRIIGLSRKVRKEAYNSGKKELVESVAGEEPTDEGMDPELMEAVKADQKEKKAKAKPKVEADTKVEKKANAKAA